MFQRDCVGVFLIFFSQRTSLTVVVKGNSSQKIMLSFPKILLPGDLLFTNIHISHNAESKVCNCSIKTKRQTGKKIGINAP